MKFAIALLVVFASLLGADEGDKPRAVQVHMYLREQSVMNGRTTAVVVEVENGSKNKVFISNQVMARRDVEVVREAKAQTDIVAETPPKEDGNRMSLQVRATCPAGAKMNWQVIDSPPETGNYEVAPGQSYLLKVVVPPEMLGVGKCKLDVAIYRGTSEVSRSESQVLDCMAAPASSVEVPTD